MSLILKLWCLSSPDFETGVGASDIVEQSSDLPVKKTNKQTERYLYLWGGKINRESIKGSNH